MTQKKASVADDQGYSLDQARHVFRFKKPCPEALSACQAMCCRKWDIALTMEESRSGWYSMVAICTLTKQPCASKGRSICPHRGFRLQKRADGACVYLKADDRCAIYGHRPLVCRNFDCAAGWEMKPCIIPSVEPPVFSAARNRVSYTQEPTGASCFMRNPLVSIKQQQIKKSAKTISFHVRYRVGCHSRPVILKRPYPGFDMSCLHDLLRLCDGKKNLKQIVTILNRHSPKVFSVTSLAGFCMLLAAQDVVIPLPRQTKKF